MAGSTFQTNPIDLTDLLHDCHSGSLQLPDFQRSWVWDEDRIKSLVASVSRVFPVGALMTLGTGAFDPFMADRQAQLIALIERATGKAAYVGAPEEEGQDVEDDEDTVEAGMTIAGAQSIEA